MKFTWNMPVECDINIFQIVTHIITTLTIKRISGVPVSDEFVRELAEAEIEFAIEGEGYTLNEVPTPVFEQIKKKVLENVFYQTEMDLGKEW